MNILRDILKRNRAAIVMVFVLSAVNLAVFLLYRIYIEPFLYACAVSFFCLFVMIAVEYSLEKKHSEARRQAIASVLTDPFDLPDPGSLAESDYQAMIHRLGHEMQRMATEFDERNEQALDYYTKWVHQIKTPIAVMKLKLSDDTPENRALSGELFRIEQYVDMVLQYIRIGSSTTDLVIQPCELDDLIRETVRKFAPQFIEKKLKLEFTPTHLTVVTDRKWFMCILDQLISNAIKYTPKGTVTISADDKVLTIADTGIGIAPEDLPRIFEKGFTGANGRLGEKSSGLGLYLARKSADLISVPLSVKSEPGQGTAFSIGITQNNEVS